MRATSGESGTRRASSRNWPTSGCRRTSPTWTSRASVPRPAKSSTGFARNRSLRQGESPACRTAICKTWYWRSFDDALQHKIIYHNKLRHLHTDPTAASLLAELCDHSDGIQQTAHSKQLCFT